MKINEEIILNAISFVTNFSAINTRLYKPAEMLKALDLFKKGAEILFLFDEKFHNYDQVF